MATRTRDLDIVDKYFPRRLRAARYSLGLTLEELGAKMNEGFPAKDPLINWKTIQRWEKGANKPTRGPALRRLATVLGVKYGWLCWGKGDPPEDVYL